VNKPEERVKQIEAAEKELEEARNELKAAQSKFRQKREALNSLAEKAVIPFFYDVKIEILEKLCKSKTPINGINDLFNRALILRDSRKINNDGSVIRDTTNAITPTQYSVRIKKQGMKAIEEYCVIDKTSPRIFYIKSMKDLSIKSGLSVNLKELNREIEIARKKKELRELQNGTAEE
jgi:hypothetical protein